CGGEGGDLPAVVRGLDAAAVAAKAPDFDDAGVFQLRAAGVALVRRGAELSLPGKSAGERMLFARAIAELPTYRPAGWEAAFTGLLRDDRACVRKAALDAFPTTPAPVLVEALAERLRDPDVAVRTAACWACLKAKSEDLEKPLLGVLAAATDDRLLYAAHTVCWRHGLAPRTEVLGALAARLDEPGMARACLKYLARAVDGRSDLDSADDPKDPYCLAGSEAAACKRAWRRFLPAHEKDLTAGKTYAFDDPALPARDLFPRVRFWRDR
ncbi:MAG: HEAT repeat domain-containing protein, partial [Zavarzinella sp.]|nr:HEAT repeat domain-containing protein [Zavarzinella sp.]